MMVDTQNMNQKSRHHRMMVDTQNMNQKSSHHRMMVDTQNMNQKSPNETLPCPRPGIPMCLRPPAALSAGRGGRLPGGGAAWSGPGRGWAARGGNLVANPHDRAKMLPAAASRRGSRRNVSDMSLQGPQWFSESVSLSFSDRRVHCRSLATGAL